ncbi:acyl-CoA dehydrogenase family protein [Amycolatopsis pigmentata]|uniref:Acyl-CoA dehydrogenase family protein n=1 Tax=Amycolatopsis pigmentata TaxID=450801 RepID=A0ABW5G0W1_9PSEU
MIDDATREETCEVLRANAEKTEQGGRPAAESLEALRGGGFLALRTPEKYGGAWAGTAKVARYLTGLGRACPSTAWVAGTCLTAKNIAVRCGTEPEVLFSDPDALCCGSGKPDGRGERGAGGVRISGRWANVSGCEDAAWAVLGLLVDGVFSFAAVPMADLAIERTWHMAGMRGTGSQTVVADDVLVPAERVATVSPFTTADLMLYSITVLGPVVGAALGALDAIGAMFASDRKPFMTTYQRMGESAGARQWLAEATHLVDRAERTMLAIAHEADTTEVSEKDSPRLHMDLADAARDCRSAVERMLDLHGASGFDTANVLQRYWRDIAVGSRHPHLNPYLAVEGYGTALTG